MSCEHIYVTEIDNMFDRHTVWWHLSTLTSSTINAILRLTNLSPKNSKRTLFSTEGCKLTKSGLSVTPLEQRRVREGGLSNPNLGSPKWFVGLSRVLLAGPRYGLSWGRPGLQGQMGVPELSRSVDGRCGGRREQVEMSGSIQEYGSRCLRGQLARGIPELTKSKKIQAVRYHYIKGRV